MNSSQKDRKRDETPMGHDAILSHVIEGIKAGVPISKTLLKFKCHSAVFYRKCDEKTKRYLNELKCLKSVDRTNQKYKRTDHFADFNLL